MNLTKEELTVVKEFAERWRKIAESAKALYEDVDRKNK